MQKMIDFAKANWKRVLIAGVVLYAGVIAYKKFFTKKKYR